MVFDNAEDPRAVAEYLPHGPGQVLVTSRNPGWRGIATPVPVQEFTRRESLALLRTVAPMLSERDADRVAAAVGDLPLVVDQAGSLLADARMDVAAYLGLLQERADELLAQDSGGTYPVSATASWEVAFDRLAADDPDAVELLTLLAWCGPQPVPLTLLTGHPDAVPDRLAHLGRDPLMAVRCTGILHRRAMVAPSPHGLVLHRIPAALLRARTHPRTTTAWPDVLVQLLHAALPGDVWNNPAAWQPWQQLLPHVLAATDTDRPLADVADEVAWLLDGRRPGASARRPGRRRSRGSGGRVDRKLAPAGGPLMAVAAQHVGQGRQRASGHTHPQGLGVVDLAVM